MINLVTINTVHLIKWLTNECQCIPVDARKSRLSLSHVIQSVAIIIMTSPKVNKEPIQNTPMRSALFLFHNFLEKSFEIMMFYVHFCYLYFCDIHQKYSGLLYLNPYT